MAGGSSDVTDRGASLSRGKLNVKAGPPLVDILLFSII